MRKLLVFPIVLVMFLLVAWQNENTIMDALNKIHKEKGFFEVLDVIETVKIDEDRTLVLYTEKVKGQEELFIAYVVSNNKNWKVTSALTLGVLSEDVFKTYIETDFIAAGLQTGVSQQLIDNNGKVRIVELENSQYKFRIAVK
ncbi:hypothetical protein V7122_25230 [Bacillus sp. JJ1532]|uniref:hypothetical protein n=1 Tax=Bacillus sp. JJ1532 TaxID=3122958 RepID=UPI002FFEEF80